MTDIRAGDVVVCVDDSRKPWLTPAQIVTLRALRLNGTYRVRCLGGGGFLPGPSIMLVGLRATYEHEGIGWTASRFRKIEAPRTELSDRIRKCRPVARPVETALDRLAARLGHAAISPDVAAGLEAGEEDRRRK